MNDKIFAQGIYFNEPNDKTPDWIIGKISIKRDNLIAFLQEQNEINGYINLDIKRGKSGKLYMELNTFQPEKHNFSADDLNGEVTNTYTGETVPF